MHLSFPYVKACYNNGKQLGPGDSWQKLSGDVCMKCTCQDDGTASCSRVLGGCQSGENEANTGYYYSTITSFYHIRTRERAKYESVLHCSKRIAL